MPPSDFAKAILFSELRVLAASLVVASLSLSLWEFAYFPSRIDLQHWASWSAIVAVCRPFRLSPAGEVQEMSLYFV